jgi:hypothetical protein
MKRKVIGAGAAAALVIGGAAWMGLGSATATTANVSVHGWPSSVGSASASKTIAAVKAAAAKDGSQVLLLRAHQVAEVDVDVNQDGFGPGDYFLFEENLRYQGSSQLVGHDSVRCTAGADSFICDGTGILNGLGKITIYGAAFGPKDNTYAVTGGTGSYKRVGGQLQTVNLRHGNELLAFDLTR